MRRGERDLSSVIRGLGAGERRARSRGTSASGSMTALSSSEGGQPVPAFRAASAICLCAISLYASPTVATLANSSGSMGGGTKRSRTLETEDVTDDIFNFSLCKT